MPETRLTFVEWFRKHWQVVYAVFLIVLVPVLIIVNALYAVETYRRNTDVALQRQALVTGRMFNLAARDALEDPEKLQALVTDAARQVEDISALEVLAPVGDRLTAEHFRILASLDPQAVGKESTQVQNVLAWTQGEAIAYLTRSAARTSADPEPGTARVGSRAWAVIVPLKDGEGVTRALLFMKLTLSTIDALVGSTLLRSYVLLAVTVLLTVLVLASNTRLFQYALLFRRLKEVDAMKDEFISMASHELRAPIAAIKGFTSLFLENAFGPFQGAAREKMQVVFQLTERLGDLVEDLLDVSRIEQGRMKVEPVPLQPEETIRQVMGELEATAKERGLGFEFRVPDSALPKIEADPARLKQVLVNIFGNALKYTPRGSVTVSAYLEEEAVKIKCTDTGLGMSAEARERLFEKFYRIRTDKTATIPGTGLGLWITKQLIELQHGRIYVDSIEGVGTQMTVAFPAMKRDASV